jgi:hypothetical protein
MAFADYYALAKLAVVTSPTTIMHVSNHYANYTTLARIAVRRDAEALAHVWRNRATYDEIARAAGRKHGRDALIFIPRERSVYAALRALVVDDDDESWNSEDDIPEADDDEDDEDDDVVDKKTRALRVVSDELFDFKDAMPEQTYVSMSNALKRAFDQV